jgi:hypothetical protein
MHQQIRMAVCTLMTCVAFAQNGPPSPGETALKTQFVTVQPDVKLEVLDWEGGDATSCSSRVAETQLTSLTA